jgi:hypothetical protein
MPHVEQPPSVALSTLAHRRDAFTHSRIRLHAIRELFAQQTIDEPIAPHAEVRAERDDAAVDARFDLAFEEGGVSELWSPR